MNLDALLSDDESLEQTLPPCKVSKVAATLEEPYLSAFRRITDTEFSEGGLPPVVAATKLAKAGLKISETTISKHRRGLCGCESVVVE
jgi:hypothetical protein